MNFSLVTLDYFIITKIIHWVNPFFNNNSRVTSRIRFLEMCPYDRLPQIIESVSKDRASRPQRYGPREGSDSQARAVERWPRERLSGGYQKEQGRAVERKAMATLGHGWWRPKGGYVPNQRLPHGRAIFSYLSFLPH
jgi:hypothetical protein